MAKRRSENARGEENNFGINEPNEETTYQESREAENNETESTSQTFDDVIGRNSDAEVKNEQISEEENVGNPIQREASNLTFPERLSSSLSNVLEFIKDLFARKRKCPYCFHVVSERDVIEREAGNSRAKETTTKNSNRKIIKATKIVNCPNPECRKDLPKDIFRTKTKNIAIVGGISSGKSTFITMLIHLLQNQNSLINDLNITTEIVNQEGKGLFKSNFKLLEKGNCIPSTSILNEPILLRVRSGFEKSKSSYVTFLDAKGEEFKSVNDILKGLPSLYNADAILLLLNPLDLRNIFNVVKENDKRGRYKLYEDYEHNEIYEMIENFYDVYLNRGLVKPGKKIKIPVVIGFTRADEIESSAEIDLTEDFEEDFHDLDFLDSEMRDISTELQDFLEDTEARLPNLTSKLFENLRFFPISAMGSRANDNKSYEDKMNPKGVLLPFLWLLKESNFKFK